MAVDTPAKIAILGAGPIGIEAAIYARFLGYEVCLYDRGHICEHLRQFAHVRLFTPFGMNCSSLGISALTAQSPDYTPPKEDELLSAGEFLEHYLEPLTRTDLLVDSIQTHTTVLQVGRDELLKGDLIGDSARSQWPFQLLVRDQQGRERFDQADIVIDATGTFGTPNFLGRGGIPALGELGACEQIEYRLPDILGTAKSCYADKHTLVIGSGYSAATNVVALAKLATQFQNTHITWVVRREKENSPDSPILRHPGDSLSERDSLAMQANQIANARESCCTLLAGSTITSIEKTCAGQPWQVRIAGESDQTVTVDEIIANTGFRPDTELHRELQVHLCYATEGPIALAAALLSHDAGDCLSQPKTGADVLVTPEPNFYILGSKSFGRQSKFLLSLGLNQIRDIFSIIGGRESLNLYQTIGTVS